MSDAPIDLEADVDKAENLPSGPLCPICTNSIEDADSNYKFKRLQPDTRWFYCEDCTAHVGYHRMKATWRLDPEDYSTNDKLRERIGLPPVAES